VLALGTIAYVINPSVTSSLGRDYSQDRNVPLRILACYKQGRRVLLIALTINCRVLLQHMSHRVSGGEQSTLALRDQHELPLKSMLLTTWFLLA